MGKLILMQSTVDAIFKTNKDYIYKFSQYGEPTIEEIYSKGIKYYKYE